MTLPLTFPKGWRSGKTAAELLALREKCTVRFMHGPHPYELPCPDHTDPAKREACREFLFAAHAVLPELLATAMATTEHVSVEFVERPHTPGGEVRWQYTARVADWEQMVWGWATQAEAHEAAQRAVAAHVAFVAKYAPPSAKVDNAIDTASETKRFSENQSEAARINASRRAEEQAAYAALQAEHQALREAARGAIHMLDRLNALYGHEEFLDLPRLRAVLAKQNES